MPNAKTHDIITVATALGAGVSYFALAPAPDTTLALLFSGTYLFAGYACAGDLDLNSKEYHRWGRFRFLWWPYRQMIPHRSRLSHGLILGGVIRILYLSLVGTLLCWLGVWLYSRLGPHVDPTHVTRSQWQIVAAQIRAYPRQTGVALAGFILAGTTHAVADGISTWFKRRF